MVTNNLKNYTEEEIINLIDSLKSKSIPYNLSDLKAVLAEVNNRKLEGDYAEVLGELIRDKILNGDSTAEPAAAPATEETKVAPAVKDEDLEKENSKKEKKEKKDKKEKKEKERVKTVQQKAKDEEYEEVEGEKYPVLSFLTGFLKFVGWVSLAVSVISGLFTSVTEYLSMPGKAISTIFTGLLVGTVVLLLCYWKSESISLKLDMEEHLEKIANK